MNREQQENLEKLRNAAEQDEWNVCREMIGILLPQLNPIDVAQLIAKQTRQFLSDLSQFNSQDADLIQAMDLFNDIPLLKVLDQQGQKVHPLLEKYWKWPGVSNFRNSLKGISRPQQYFEHDGEYKDTVVSIISGILMAIATNAYWGGNDEFSKTFFGSDNRAALMMLVKADKDPQNVEIRKLVWTELADDIEVLLYLDDLESDTELRERYLRMKNQESNADMLKKLRGKSLFDDLTNE